jgi:hypothetical protein
MKWAIPWRLRNRRHGQRFTNADVASTLRPFRFSLKEYHRLLQAQEGLCAICRQLPTKRLGERKRLAIDHDHKTGRVRGLLCDRCNGGLGSFDDDPEKMERAIQYVRGYLGAELLT